MNLPLTPDEADLVALAADDLNWSPGKNWVENVGGLPRYIRDIAKALIRNGHSRESAIAIAVSRVKKWAAGGANVKADTRAKAAKALAEWEAKRAKSKAKTARKLAASHTGWADDPMSDTELEILVDDLELSRSGPVGRLILELGKTEQLKEEHVHTLADGSYPIPNVAYLKKAIQAFGRAKDKKKAKAHIIARAKALGRTDLIPENW